MKKIKQIIRTASAEILLVFGAFFIVFATMRVSKTAGLFVIGVILAAAGVFVAKNRG